MLMIGTPCVYCFLWKAIQHEEMFGFWQKVIDKVYSYSENLAKFIGDCQICFSHFIAWVCMAVFVALNWYDWPFRWYTSIVFVLVHISILWWLGIVAKQVMDKKMHEAFIKEKEAEYLKDQDK